MYSPGQIVYDHDLRRPVVAYSTGRRTTHFIESIVSSGMPDIGYGIALPKNTEEAQTLLKNGVISPAPLPKTHCYKCFNWLSNHNKDGSCWLNEEQIE